jgi:hypothetical protein
MRKSATIVTRLTPLVVIILATLGIIACGPSALPNNTAPERIPVDHRPRTVKPAIKDVGHTEIIRETDRQLSAVGILPLRTENRPADSFEVRVWKGWGMRGTKGIILRRPRGRWIASLVSIPSSGRFSRPTIQVLQAPHSGWEVVWQALIENRILDLPDDSEVGEVEPFEDSEQIVVDLLINSDHRTYSYNAPCYSEVDEGRNVKRIVEILGREFDVTWFSCD